MRLHVTRVCQTCSPVPEQKIGLSCRCPIFGAIVEDGSDNPIGQGQVLHGTIGLRRHRHRLSQLPRVAEAYC